MTPNNSVLMQASETWRYATDDRLHNVTMSDTLDSIFAIGETSQGRGILHRISKNNENLWRQEFAQPLSTIGVASGGGFVGVGSDDQQLYFFDKHGQLLWKHPGRSKINTVDLSFDGRFTIAGFQDGNIMFFDNSVAAKKFVWKHKFETKVNDTDISANGDLVVACTEEGDVALFTDQGINSWTKDAGKSMYSICISRNGDNVVAGGADGLVIFYVSGSGQTLWTFQADGPVVDMAMTGRGERIVMVTRSGTVLSIDSTGKELWRFSMGEAGERIDMARNGKCIVATTVGTRLFCLDLNGNLLYSYGMNNKIEDLKISPTGDHIVAAAQSSLFFFDNLQVCGGIVPRSQQAIGKARNAGRDTAQAQKHYDEAVAALSNGDYLRAMFGVRNMERSLVTGTAPPKSPAPSKPAAPPLQPKPAAAPVPPELDIKRKLEDEIGHLLEKGEELKNDGKDINKVESILGDAAMLVEEGNYGDAETHIANVKVIIKQLEGPGADAKPAPTTRGSKAPVRVDHGIRLLAVLKTSDAPITDAEENLEHARSALNEGDEPKALLFAEKAITDMEGSLDVLISDILKNVSSLLEDADNMGIDTTDVRDMLVETNGFMKDKKYDSALETAKECEEWLAVKLEAQVSAPEPETPAAPKPVPKPSAVPKPPAALKPVPRPPAVPKPPAAPKPVPRPPATATDRFPELEDFRGSVGEITGRMEDVMQPLEEGDLEDVVEVYVGVMDTAEEAVKNLVTSILENAGTEMAKYPDIPNEPVKQYIIDSNAKLEIRDFVGAIGLAMKAKEEACNTDKLEAHRAIKEVKEKLELAERIGAELSRAKTAVAEAEKALSNQEYGQVQQHTGTAIAEIETTQTEFVSKEIASAEEVLTAARKIGADVIKELGVIEKAKSALEHKDYHKALELAKQGAELAAAVPVKHINGILIEATKVVMDAQAMGANTINAKNSMIRAKGALTKKDYEEAYKFAKLCEQEAQKAPAMLVAQKAAATRSEMANAQSMGVDVSEVEKVLEEAKAKAQAREYKAAVDLLRSAKETIAAKMEEGTMATDVVNLIFEVDMAISAAAGEGKDVSPAQEKLNEAMALQESDPEKAKELAEEAKGFLGQ